MICSIMMGTELGNKGVIKAEASLEAPRSSVTSVFTLL